MDLWTLIAVLAVVVAIVLYLRTSMRRETYVITCPDNLQPAAVGLAPFDDTLSSCSRWPEMADCAQDCLRQIDSSPHDCLVRTIVARWYARRDCHYCHSPIGGIVWHERPPALLLPDGTTREWKDVAPQDLSTIFNGAEAVCWTCHIVETFRREHPEQVIERPRPVTPLHPLAPSADVY